MRYDGQQWYRFTEDDGWPGGSVMALLQAQDGTLWTGANNKLYRYDGQTWQVVVAGGLAHGRPWALLQTQDGAIWAGGYNGKGVSRYDGQRMQIFTPEDGLAAGGIYSLLQTQDGMLWTGGDGVGLSRYDGQTWRTFSTEDGLAGNPVRSLVKTADGTLLIGTWGGLSHYYRQQWQNITTEDGLASNSVRALLQTEDGVIWVGTGDGLCRYDGKTWQTFTEDDGLASNAISSLLQTSDGALWVGTLWGDGLSRYDGRAWITFTTDDGLPKRNINSLIQTSDGVLWIGTGNVWFGGSLARYDGRNWQTFDIPSERAQPGKITMLQSQDGALWGGTYWEGVFRYDGKEWTRFTVDDGLAGNSVESLLQEPDSTLWIGTAAGLSSYDGESWYSFTQKDGLMGLSVQAMLRTSDGKLWLGTRDGGLNVYDGRCFQSINTEDGLLGNNVSSLLQASDGALWVGTDKGISRIIPNKTPPRPWIRRVTIDDESFENPKDKIQVSGSVGRLSVEYRGITFHTRKGGIKYFTQLVKVGQASEVRDFGYQGKRDGWSKPTNEERVEYTNLEPGEYTFKMQAVDRFLNYSEPVTLTLRVKRPWWVFALFGTIGISIPLVVVGFYFGKRLQTQRAIAQQFNPYIAGRVVGEDLFYGRNDLITDIERTLHNNCFLLYGERRIGKTSLQHQLAERLSNADDPTYKFIPAYIDLQGVAEDDFFRTIATGIVEHAASLFESPNGQAARSTEDPLPLRLNEARDRYSYRDFTRDLRTILDHLKEGETKTIKLVLLMDEIDTLNEYSLRTNLNLRGLFMGPFKENLVLVMSGLYLKMDWSEEGGGSPPFNFLSREIQLEPLDEESARKLVTEPVKGFYSYESESVNLIIEYSELKPFTIQGFCLRAVARILADGRTKITVDDIEAIKDSVLAELSSIRGERAGTSLPASLNEALALLSEAQSRIADLEAEDERVQEERA